VCPKCGAYNPIGRQSCRACSEPLGEGVDEMDTYGRGEMEGSQTANGAEATPEWLQLLLAKYGEETPTLSSLSPPAVVEEAPAAAPPAIKETSDVGEQSAADDGTEDIPEWLESLRVSGSVAADEKPDPSQPQVARDDVGEPDAIEADSAASDWLSRLDGVSSDRHRSVAAPKAASAEDVPEWLTASLEEVEMLEESQPAASPGKSSVPERHDREIPEWLSRLGEAEESVSADEVPEHTGAVDRAIRAGQPSPDAVSPLVSRSVEPAPPSIIDEDRSMSFGNVATNGEPPPAIIDTGELKAREAKIREEVAPPPSVKEVEKGVPDWLAQLISSQEEAAGAAEEATLSGGGAEEAAVSVTSGAAPPQDERPGSQAMVEIPPWLAELNVSEIEELEPVGAEALEIPPFLEEMEREDASRQAQAEEVAMEPSAPTRGEAREYVQEQDEPEGLPDWLSQLHSLDETDSTSLEAMPGQDTEPAVYATEDKSDWLSNWESMATSSEDALIGVDEQSREEEAQVPDWLREMQAEASQPQPAEASPVAEEMPVLDDIERADIPAWIHKLRPEGEADEEGQPVPGLPDVLPISDDAEEEETFASLRARLSMPEVPDVEGASLFREIASDMPEPRPAAEEPPKGGGLFATLVWGLVFIILILAIAITLMAVLNRADNLLGASAFQEYLSSPAGVALVGSVLGFRAEIAALPEDSVVLVCFDYSPATEAEMGLLADVILKDLSQHQMRVIAVSLRPEGAMLAHRMTEALNGESGKVRAVNLGYLPGNAVGIRSLVGIQEMTSFEGRERLNVIPGWEDVDALTEVSMVVEIADDSRNVRWWVEQQQALGLADRPLLVAVSAASAPASRPYREVNLGGYGHLEEMISGITAAAAYELDLNGPGRAVKMLAAQSVTHLGLVLVAVAGTIAGFRN
jgi:hypothetical protein